MPSSPRAAASSKALTSSSLCSYHHVASSASVANSGIFNFVSADSQIALLAKIKIDQFLGCTESCDDAKARFTLCRNDDQEATQIRAPDAGKPLFAPDCFSVDIERI